MLKIAQIFVENTTEDNDGKKHIATKCQQKETMCYLNNYTYMM